MVYKKNQQAETSWFVLICCDMRVESFLRFVFVSLLIGFVFSLLILV